MAGEQPDDILITACLGGDAEAFAALYDRYADRIHSFAYSRLRDPADAADALQTTFITAHRRLDQLADPTRFRPWLFAIARTTITDIGRGRARRATETSTDAASMPELPSDDRGPDRDIEAAESAALLWEAAAGLQPRDQELLELHLREGLEGADLAEAMDVEPSHLYVMVKRLKERLGTAVGSLLVARRGRADCADLDRLLAGWDGRFSLDVRGRVNRHIESCETCGETRKAAIAWEQIAAAIPTVPAPATSRAAVLAATVGIVGVAGTGTTAVATTEPGSTLLATVASVVATIGLTVGLLAWPVVFGDDPAPVEVAGVVETNEATTTEAPTPTDPTTTVAPATTAILLGPGPSITAPPTTGPTTTSLPPTTTTSTPPTTTTTAPIGPILGSPFTEVDLGATLDTVEVILTNEGDQPLTWSATIPTNDWFSILGESTGAIEPGTTATVTVAFDRDTATGEGDYPATPLSLTVTDDADDTLTLPLRAAVERPPEILTGGSVYGLGPNPILEVDAPCAENSPLPQSTTVSAQVFDDSQPVSVRAIVTRVDPAESPRVIEMDAIPNDPGGYRTPSIELPAGLYKIAVEATDDRGNTATVQLSTDPFDLTVESCPGFSS